MPVLGQRRDRDVREVIGVDERLRCVPGRERDLAAAHRFQQDALAEVRILGAAFGSPMSGEYARYTDPTSCSAGAQVA
ncbi:MAG: hypothetical protein ACRDRP_13310 [Pseudonocardiaceae bacterium]